MFFNLFVLKLVILMSVFLQYNCKHVEKKHSLRNELDDPNECWISLNASGLAAELNGLRQTALGGENIPVLENILQLDAKMQANIVKDKGAAERAVHERRGEPRDIPAGLNLGGHGMLRLSDAVLFFHRLKLRNSTRFRVNYLHNEEDNFMVTMRLSLNDLRLFGSYERARTRVQDDQSIFFYTPTYGEVEFLLKNVNYKVEGRYRMLVHRAHIENIISSIDVKDVFMTYQGTNNVSNQCMDPKTSVTLQRENIEDFIANIKTSLDEWLKDYYNDFMTFERAVGKQDLAGLLAYDKQSSIILNQWVDDALDMLKVRMCGLNVATVRIPSFTISTTNAVIQLKEGIVRGLDSIYRRSMATTKLDNKVRYVDAKIGFGGLRVSYQYVIEGYNEKQPSKGKFIMTADDLTGLLTFSLLNNPDSTDLHIQSLHPVRPEVITMRGEGNRIIAKVRHLLEQQIMALMINSLYYNIRLIRTLVDCEPGLIGQVDLKNDDCFKNKTFDDSSREISTEEGNKGDFVLLRNDSVELEIPATGGADSKTQILKVQHNEKFILKQMPVE